MMKIWDFKTWIWRRALALLLAMLWLGSAAGCSILFDREYYTRAEYEAQDTETDTDDGDAIGSISNYTALKRAITLLVTEHIESAQLQFLNYDGNISTDISTACWEVKSSTALGAFAVDYISYDLSRIVSYYQAEIYITYKRSAAQVEALEEIATTAALSQRIDTALRSNETYLVLELSSTSVTADTIAEYLEAAYYTDPLASPVLPVVEVSFYPESGVDRIAEITIDYGMDSQELNERREALALAVETVTAALQTEVAEEPEADDDAEAEDATASDELTEQVTAEADMVYALCEYITEHCTLEDTAGTTAWDALVNGTADSQGIAMALEALCQALDIECVVVAGRLSSEAHYWNIVTLDGVSYHVDTAHSSDEGENLFLVSDAMLWGAYWWDTSEYPVCDEAYGYFEEAVELEEVE